MKVLIETPTWIGDCVMITPSIRNLIDCYKNIDITIIGPESTIQLLKRHPNVHSVYPIEKNTLKTIRFILSLDKDFDMFISYRSSLRTSIFKSFIKAPKKYQFNKNLFRSGHQVEKYSDFINSITGIKKIPRELELFNSQESLKVKPFKGQIMIGINPGAAFGSAKRWTKEGFINSSIRLSKFGQIVIFGGRNEIDLCNLIENALMESNVDNYRNLGGKTDIESLIAEISKLNLFITGDSGPMHIAAAFQIPTISIFGPTISQETSQWKNKFTKIIYKNLECQPCMKRSCPLKHHNCMELIKSDEVFEESLKLLGKININ